MWRLMIVLLFIVLMNDSAHAQNVSQPDAVIRFLGTDDPEELHAEEVEKLQDLLDSPLRLNVVSESVLRESGLLTPYQVASLSDYVSRHGAVLSYSELSLVDGFGDDFVRRIAPFIILENVDKSQGGVRHDMAVRTGLRIHANEGSDGSYGLKYRVEGGHLKASVAASRSAGTSTWAPSSISGSMSLQFRRLPLRIVAGDFNARFGQGLVMWNNSFLNSLTNPDTFMKKPTGITQPWSFTGSGTLRGLAAEYVVKGLHICALASYESHHVTPAVNVAWYGRFGQVSMTVTSSECGIDAAVCVRGVNIFGEVAYDWRTEVAAALAGTRFKVGERLDAAAQIRAYSGDQYGAALGTTYSLGSKGQLTLSSDATYYPISKDKDDPYSFQLKSQFSGEVQIGSCWKLKFRLSERIRTWGLPYRTDVRTDVVYSCEPFVCTARINVLSCDGVGFLSYLEGGYKTERHSVYLRQGLFIVDDWDDRIYVYERDAPGSFNAPAMYGRGVWTSITSSSRLTRALRLYARASYIGYPMMEKKKPGKAELKLQLQYRF